jgi:FkbM family methyltransferase
MRENKQRMVLAVEAGVRLGSALQTSKRRQGKRSRVLLSDQDVLIRTPFGPLIAPAEDEALIAALRPSGVLEKGTTSVVCALIRRGDTVIDVGAHIGLLTLPAAKRVGPLGLVVAIEPLPRLAALLRQNMQLNGMADRVRVEAAACSAHPGRASFFVGKILGHSSLLPIDNQVDIIDVPLRTVDELVRPGRRVSLVKIDAEGNELRVLRGMHRIIAENPDLSIIVEFGPSHLQRFGLSVDEWLQAFSTNGFHAYEIDERSGVCTTLRLENLESVFSINILWIRRPPSRYPKIRFVGRTR